MTVPAQAAEAAAERRPEEARRAAWRNTWLLLTFMLVNFADKAVLGLASKPIMHDLHLTRDQFGAASSAFFALFSLSALLVSFLTRRVGSTRLLLGMGLLWSLAQLPIAFNLGFGALVGTRLLLGAAEGPAFPVATHHLFGWFRHEDRQLPTAVLTVGAAAGLAVSAPILTAVIDQAGWHVAFLTVGLLGLAWSLAWLRWGRTGPEAGSEATTAQDGERVPYRRILLSGTWLAAALGAFAAYWHLASFLTWTADYLQTVVGMTAARSGLVITLAAAVSGVLLIGYGTLAQRWERTGRTRLPVWACTGALALSGLATALFGVTGSTGLKILLLALPMASSPVIIVMAQTAVGRVAPAAQRAVSLGSLALVFSLAGALSPLVVGRLVDQAATPAAGYRDGYLLSAALLLVAALVTALCLRPRPRTP